MVRFILHLCDFIFIDGYIFIVALDLGISMTPEMYRNLFLTPMALEIIKEKPDTRMPRLRFVSIDVYLTVEIIDE